MGGAKRYPLTPVGVAMGIASLHPSYADTTSRSRGAFRPRFDLCLPSSENRGRREDRVLAAPAVSRAICANKTAHEHTGQREHSGLPCAMALRLTSCSSRRTALLPPSPREASLLLDLAPAPRRPNHTTSPYASGAYVYRALSVHRISPRVRDDGQRPSSAVRRAELCGLIWVRTKAEYFSILGLTRFLKIRSDLPVVLVGRTGCARLPLHAKQISSQSVGWAKRAHPTKLRCSSTPASCGVN